MPLDPKSLKETKYTPRKKREKLRLRFAAYLVFVIAVLIVAYVFLVKPIVENGLGERPVLPNISSPDEIPPECDEDCIIEMALNESDEELCEYILDDEKRQLCYEELSLYSLEACMEVEDYSVLKVCSIEHAKKMDSVEPCSFLNETDEKECILEVDPCYYMEESERRLCRAMAKENYSYCEGDVDCIFEYAEKTGTWDVCNELEKLYMQYACVSMAKGSEVCTEIPAGSTKELCLLEYAKRSNQSGVCEYIKETDVNSYDCFLYFAIKTGKWKFCNSLILDYRWSCLTNYSLVTGDIEGCKGIEKQAPISRKNCFSQYAIEYHNPSICEYIDDATVKYRCYYTSILLEGAVIAPENCEDVAADQWRNKCYTNSAISNGDESICENIETAAERDLCLSNFN